MLELLSENENIWDFLSKDKKPVVVYGMGNGAEKIIASLNEYGVKVSDIFASDEFVRGHSFLGYRVLKYSDICEKYDDFNIVLAFATHIEDVLERIKAIDSQHKVFAPDVAVCGGGLFTLEYVKENEKEFDFAYNHLADEESKSCFIDIINFKISGKIEYLFKHFADKNDIYKNILKLNDNEIIADLGAYDGDTIREFTAFTKGNYQHIYALEPDEKNFKKLKNKTQEYKNLTIYNAGAWHKEDTLIFSKEASRNSKLSSSGVPVKVYDIDTLINNKLTMIKMDIEGSEINALNGAKNLIKKYNPKLYVCAYHRNSDMFTIPKKIIELNPNYKIYFRHSPYIPAWESNFYAVI